MWNCATGPVHSQDTVRMVLVVVLMCLCKTCQIGTLTTSWHGQRGFSSWEGPAPHKLVVMMARHCIQNMPWRTHVGHGTCHVCTKKMHSFPWNSTCIVAWAHLPPPLADVQTVYTTSAFHTLPAQTSMQRHPRNPTRHAHTCPVRIILRDPCLLLNGTYASQQPLASICASWPSVWRYCTRPCCDLNVHNGGDTRPMVHGHMLVIKTVLFYLAKALWLQTISSVLDIAPDHKHHHPCKKNLPYLHQNTTSCIRPLLFNTTIPCPSPELRHMIITLLNVITICWISQLKLCSLLCDIHSNPSVSVLCQCRLTLSFLTCIPECLHATYNQRTPHVNASLQHLSQPMSSKSLSHPLHASLQREHPAGGAYE